MAKSSDEKKTDIRVLVAALDFGTTYSGYAFSFKSDYDEDPSLISHNTVWEAPTKSQGLVSPKTPTCLLLKPNKTFDSFGYAAEENYSDLVNNDSHHSWYYFRRFKMLLHDNMGLTRKTMIHDESREKTLPAITVFAHGIRYLKNHLLDHLKKKKLENLIPENENYIHWVLTVPAIWNDKAKQFMREAAKEAGIKTENLSLALEPEAAALYCQILPLERRSTESGSCLSILKPGTRYLVLDAGGGTVDVTVQEVLSDNSLQELHKASGGAWGGMEVDEAFRQLLIRIVGSPVLHEFKTKYPVDYLEMFRDFETKKRAASTSAKQKLAFRLPVSLMELFEEEYEEDLLTTVSQMRHNDRIKLVRENLYIYDEQVLELFRLSRENIIQHINELLAHSYCKDVDIILMVGGFSECKIIQEAIKANFPTKKIVVPVDAGLAVVKGAVLFGHNPKKIVSRKTKWTYGVQTNRNFQPGDPPDKKFQVENVDKCKDIFSVHVGVNETVEVGTPLPPRRYNVLHKDAETVDIPIYISSEALPKFTSDSTCSYIGKLTIEPEKSNNDREIEVGMTFGGTELIVEAKETRSGNPRVAKFDFLEIGKE